MTRLASNWLHLDLDSGGSWPGESWSSPSTAFCSDKGKMPCPTGVCVFPESQEICSNVWMFLVSHEVCPEGSGASLPGQGGCSNADNLSVDQNVCSVEGADIASWPGQRLCSGDCSFSAVQKDCSMDGSPFALSQEVFSCICKFSSGQEVCPGKGGHFPVGRQDCSPDTDVRSFGWGFCSTVTKPLSLGWAFWSTGRSAFSESKGLGFSGAGSLSESWGLRPAAVEGLSDGTGRVSTGVGSLLGVWGGEPVGATSFSNGLDLRATGVTGLTGSCGFRLSEGAAFPEGWGSGPTEMALPCGSGLRESGSAALSTTCPWGGGVVGGLSSSWGWGAPIKGDGSEILGASKAEQSAALSDPGGFSSVATEDCSSRTMVGDSFSGGCPFRAPGEASFSEARSLRATVGADFSEGCNLRATAESGLSDDCNLRARAEDSLSEGLNLKARVEGNLSEGFKLRARVEGNLSAGWSRSAIVEGGLSEGCSFRATEEGGLSEDCSLRANEEEGGLSEDCSLRDTVRGSLSEDWDFGPVAAGCWSDGWVFWQPAADSVEGAYSRISPGSRGLGPQGSCSVHDRRPSNLEMNSMPSLCCLQNDRGHISQKEAASLLHTSHWCQGHSHFPAAQEKAWLTWVMAVSESPWNQDARKPWPVKAVQGKLLNSAPNSKTSKCWY